MIVEERSNGCVITRLSQSAIVIVISSVFRTVGVVKLLLLSIDSMMSLKTPWVAELGVICTSYLEEQLVLGRVTQLSSCPLFCRILMSRSFEMAGLAEIHPKSSVNKP